MSALFITATGTGIGKTFVACCMTWQLKEKRKDVYTIKPIITGFEDGKENDTTLLQSLQPGTSVEDISPWRYQTPIAPSQAAQREGRAIDSNEVIRFCKDAIKSHEITLIEGIGGALVPLRPNYMVVDWIRALDIPVLVVTGSYLGTLSHTFTCLESLTSRNIPVKGVVVSQSEEELIDLDETLSALQAGATSIPFLGLPRIAKEEPWKHAPDLTAFLD